MNLNIATNTKEALMTAESVISRLFALQAGAVAAVQQIAEGLQKMTEDVDAKNAETQALIKKLREAIALVDKSIDKEIDAGIDRHNAKPADIYCNDPDSCGCPHHDDCVALKAAAEATAEQSSAVAPQDEAPQPEPEAAAPAPIQPSYDDAKAAVINLGKTLGREAITELLAGFNAKRLPEVPQDQLAYVIAAANKRLEQHFFEENEQALAEDLGEAGW